MNIYMNIKLNTLCAVYHVSINPQYKKFSSLKKFFNVQNTFGPTLPILNVRLAQEHEDMSAEIFIVVTFVILKNFQLSESTPTLDHTILNIC